MAYSDSLGNHYQSLPKAPPQHTAKAAKETSTRRSSRRKDPRSSKVNKHAAYRMRVGRPNGPGASGNKAGKNK